MRIDNDTLTFIEYPKSHTQRLIEYVIKKKECSLTNAFLNKTKVDEDIIRKEWGDNHDNKIRRAIIAGGKQ